MLYPYHSPRTKAAFRRKDSRAANTDGIAADERHGRKRLAASDGVCVILHRPRFILTQILIENKDKKHLRPLTLFRRLKITVRVHMYQGIPPVFPPVQASIPYRKFRYARYSPPYPTENLGIRRKNTESSVGVPVRPPYPTENLGTLGIDLHTLPKISVRSVQPSYPTEHLGIRRENTEISVGVSVQPPYLTENLGTLGTALHTLPKISVRSVQPSIPYRAYPYRTEHTLGTFFSVGRATSTYSDNTVQYQW